MIFYMSILHIPMPKNDVSARNVREFLVALAAAVWEQGDAFSGKRPWGNSGWEYDVYEALIRSGRVYGTFDEDGFIQDFDEEAANSLVAAAFEELARA